MAVERFSDQANNQNGLTFASYLMIAAVCFNALLAFVNAHLMPISPMLVMAAEACILCAATVVALCHFDRSMIYWLLFAYCFIIIFLTRSLLLEELQLKPVRDMLIISTFVTLGATISRLELKKSMLILNAIVLLFLALETFRPDDFSELLNIKSYYVNTRGFSEESFWNEESELFLSATRPNERFLEFLDLHRMSSIFLEPPSLGNFSIILSIYLLTEYERLKINERLQLSLGIILTIIASDSRLGSVTILMFFLLHSLRIWRCANLHYIYFWASLGVAAFAVYTFGLEYTGDNFQGRTVFALESIARLDVFEWLGISKTSPTLDSGHEYLILTQSVFGLLLFWLFTALGLPGQETPVLKFNHFLSLYLALNLIVSAAVFSLKTAAPLWFMYGALMASTTSGRKPLYFHSEEGVNFDLTGQKTAS